MKKLLPLGALLMLAGLGQSAQADDNNVFRLGISNINPHSSATDATGPFLLQPDSGVSLSVKSQSTLHFSYARKLSDKLDLELALGVPPTHDVTAKLNPNIV
ncbi:MAG: hypothetical protein JOY84_06540, partial [Curvibacter sp.]|nr:hypothetical protein [Curvibacter sp.]